MIGRSVSHYWIIEKLSQGGMGEVYRAEYTNLHRHVAIKMLASEFAQNPARLARFQREAELLSSLSHPNIATIHGLEESEGQRFIVMELTLTEQFDDSGMMDGGRPPYISGLRVGPPRPDLIT